ncbi:MAG: hypothetical protein PWP60_484, partial [Candidatus Atribacteria bacterium]|nr:hypothetical protein [Candidatus Atribacteria bacterium]
TLEIKELVVEELVIKDKDGRARIRMGVDSTNSPIIFFYDQTGKKRLSLSAGPAEREIAQIILYSEEQPVLALESREGIGKLFLAEVGRPEITATVDSFKIRVLEFNLRQNSITTITNKLIQWSLYATPTEDPDAEGLAVYVETRPAPSWKVNFEEVKLSTSAEEIKNVYQEAGEYLYREILRPNFPALSPEKLTIYFSMYGYKIGIWKNGTIKLAGEE